MLGTIGTKASESWIALYGIPAVPRRGRRVSGKEEQDELIAQYGVLAAINTGLGLHVWREELLSLSLR